MKKTTKTLISAILALLMIVSVLPMPVIALDGNDFELVAGTLDIKW